MIKAAVVGGTGYTGVELLRILVAHPEVQLRVITSRAEAGLPVAEKASGYSQIPYDIFLYLISTDSSLDGRTTNSVNWSGRAKNCIRKRTRERNGRRRKANGRSQVELSYG